jgi:hypothetical protein
VANPRQYGAQRPWFVAVVGGGSATAIAPSELRVNKATLRPVARGIVVERDARRGRRPASLGLLLVLHCETEAAVPGEPAEPIDQHDTSVDELNAA